MNVDPRAHPLLAPSSFFPLVHVSAFVVSLYKEGAKT